MPETTAKEARAAGRYKLSFSVGGLFLVGASVAAGLYAEHRSWEAVRSELETENLLQARTSSTAKRLGRELVQRLQGLTETEIELLSNASADERAQMMWVAACRRYDLIAGFAEEVLRERFLLMASDIKPEHFEAFVRGRTLWHPELAELEESTLRKLRTNLFLMMREGDLVTADGSIIPAVLSSRVRDELSKRRPSDVRFFPTREAA